VGHPGDTWPKLVTQSPGRLPLLFSGRRHIHAEWPPGALCEYCVTASRQGYCGHVPDGSITYPAPQIRYICEPCIRRVLRLGPEDLIGHNCSAVCSDTQHVEVAHFRRGTLETMTHEQRVAVIEPTYQPKGWAVTSVVPAITTADGGVSRWEIALAPQYLRRS